jgi:hypothetical protein
MDENTARLVAQIEQLGPHIAATFAKMLETVATLNARLALLESRLEALETAASPPPAGH